MNPRPLTLTFLAATALALGMTSTHSKDTSLPVGTVSALTSQWGKFNLPIEMLLPVSQFRPGLPMRPGPTKPTTVTYSRSATAGNMVTPAILLGAPIMVILALIIIAMKGD